MSETTLDLGRRRQLLAADAEPCDEGLRWWLDQPDNATAWDTCQRGDWLLWLVCEAKLADDSTIRLIACDSVRELWHLLTDERSRTAVETAERFARGLATSEELATAGAAAWVAFRDATEGAAGGAAEAAAEAAAWATKGDTRVAARAATWAAAEAAAREAALGAARYAAWAAACDGAWVAAMARQAEIVRARVLNPYRR